MIDLWSGSCILRVGRRLAEGFAATARQSLILGRRPLDGPMEKSGLAAMLRRIHPMEAAVGGMAESSLLGWLYDYWGSLCATPVKGLIFLLVPLFFLLSARMLLAGRMAMCGILLGVLGLSLLLLWAKGTLGGWLKGSLLGRRLSLPEGSAKRSTLIYLAVCGLLGGGLGWFAGVTYGVAAALALALLPAVVRIPPAWMLCLLLGLLPVLGTAACWGLSAMVVVVYFFARAFGGLSGKRINGLDLMLAAFPLLCIVSTVFSVAFADSAKVTVMWLGLYLAVPLVRRIVTDRKKLAAALTALTAGAAAAGLYGLYQYLSGMTNDTWTDTALFNNIQLRVYSTFANPNVYGEFLLLTIPLVAGFALYMKGTKRWLLLAVDGLLAVNMLLSYSRGCYVGIALTALVFLWYFSKKWLAVAAVIGIPLGMMLMPESVMARILSIGNMSDTSTNYRIMIYIGTFLMFADFWFGGVGIGERAYNTIYPFYALPEVTAQHSHSLIFQSVVSFGAVGLVYLLTLWGGFQRRMVRVYRELPRRERLLMCGFCSVMWGMLVQSIFDYTWYNYRVFQLFWLVIALGYAAAEVLLERRKEDD